MLDAPPREPEWQSWCYVAVGVVIIYSTIPVARTIRESVDARIGNEIFLICSIVLVLVGGIMAFRNLRRRTLSRGAYIWLGGILTAFIAQIYSLQDIPEEAIHVAEYALISFMVFRALVHRIRDYGIYLIATMITGMVGMVDEYIQWFVPNRVFDLADIATNFIAGGTAQFAIFAGMRPRLIKEAPTAESWRRICNVGVALIVILGVGFLNTPQRIYWYGNLIPSFAFLMDNKGMMVEYGYRYEDMEIGVFRSRFTRAQLKLLDQQRGSEVAITLDRYIRGEGYGPFQSIYTVVRDAYTHEAGVHLFRREYYIDRARESIDKQGTHYNIAYRENQILEKYFSKSISNSTHHWGEEVVLEVSSNALKTIPYESTVSAGIITRFNEWQIMSIFGISGFALLLTGAYLGGSRRAAEKL